MTRVSQSQSAKILEEYNVKVSLIQHQLYILFILAVVKVYFTIPKHVVHSSTLTHISKAVALKAHWKGGAVCFEIPISLQTYHKSTSATALDSNNINLLYACKNEVWRHIYV